MKKNSEMGKFSPAIGLTGGAIIGAGISIILNKNIAMYIGMGAGIGLIIGAIIYGFIEKE